MSGFQAPNYTQVPNDFFEMARDMDKAELKVVLYIIRETFGYHREECQVSIRKLAIGAGLTPRNAYNGAEKAIARGLIEKTVSPTNITTWRAVVAGDTVVLSQRIRTVSPRKVQVPVKESKEIEIKKNEDDERTAEIGKVYKTYQSEIGVITPMIADSIDGWIKDGFPLKWLCDAFHESSAQGKRSWKYCEAIIKRWDAQGNQEAMKPVLQTYKQKASEPKAFEAIRQWIGDQNGNSGGSIENDSPIISGVPQLERKQIHDASLL